MDPEFSHLLLRVVAIGSLIGAIGAGVLYFVFRRFGGAKAGGASHMGLIAALVAFLFACSVVLFALSYGKD